MAERKFRLLTEPKKTLDLVEYLIIRVILMSLLILGGLGLIWHAMKLLWSLF